MREHLTQAGSAGFDARANLHVEIQGRTSDIPVTYVGDWRVGYNTAKVEVSVFDHTIESRVISFIPPYLITTHVLDSSSESWEVTHGNSPYYVELSPLFGLSPRDLTDLEVIGQQIHGGVNTHIVSGKLRDFRIAGASGNFDVVYSIGVDDDLLREVSAFGRLELDDDPMLIGHVAPDEASLELTVTLADHGKQVDIVTPSLAMQRYGHTAVALDDGRALVGGGFTGLSNANVLFPFPVGSIQIYDPETSMWSIPEPLEGPGIYYTAVKLSDGRVLTVGIGISDTGEPESMASIFDPVSESWTSLPGPDSPRGDPDLILLDDGRVLVAGGFDISGPTSTRSPDVVTAVEIFDPATETWQQAASKAVVSHEQWLVRLKDGRLLAIAAVSDDETAVDAAIYDPASDKWIPVNSVDPLYRPINVIGLLDGRILVIGGLSATRSRSTWDGVIVQAELPDGKWLNAEELEDRFPSAKIYDPFSDTWSSAGVMGFIRTAATLTLLPDGRVLAAGGEYGWSKDFLTHSTTEIYDPQTNSWSRGRDLSELRAGSSTTVLPDGSVLLVGGIGMVLDIEEIYPLPTSEIFDPN